MSVNHILPQNLGAIFTSPDMGTNMERNRHDPNNKPDVNLSEEASRRSSSRHQPDPTAKTGSDDTLSGKPMSPNLVPPLAPGADTVGDDGKLPKRLPQGAESRCHLRLPPLTIRSQRVLDKNNELGIDAPDVFEVQPSNTTSGPDGVPQNADSEDPSITTKNMKAHGLSLTSNLEIPEELYERFIDLRILHSQALVKAISKGKVKRSDVSMKLKYLGGDKQQPPKLYIVVHCEKRVAKRVKNFFNQRHVLEDLGSDFQVHIVDSGIVPLSSLLGQVLVYGDTHSGTMCGTKIVLTDENETTQVVATLGGIILTKSGNTMTLYGLTAGHAIANVYGQDYYDAINTYSEQGDGSCSDDDDDYDDDDDDDDDDDSDLSETDPAHRPGDNMIVPALVDNQTTDGDTKPPLFGIIDGVVLPPRAVNCDWGLIPFLEGDTPDDNCIYLGSPPAARTPFDEEYVSLESEKPVPVAVITSRGNQEGTLANNWSTLLSTVGRTFVGVFDFTPGPESRLIPGDSGAWVVNASTGEVYGHVVSVDSFGEAYVVPIQWTLNEIRSHLRADSVTLPTKQDMKAYRGPRKEAQNVMVESQSRESDYPDSVHSTKDDPPTLAYRSNSKLSQ